MDPIETSPDFSDPATPEPMHAGVMPTSREILRSTRTVLAGRWGRFLLVMWIAFLCQAVLGAGFKIGAFLGLFLSGPFYVGISAFALAMHRETQPDWETILHGLDRFARNVAAFFLLACWILLGLVLLIVPAILWMLSYSQIFFLLADHPELSASQALNRSREMMYGHRLQLASLQCWLCGLYLLSILTLGIGLIWLIPYSYACQARFYEALRNLPSVSPAA